MNDIPHTSRYLTMTDFDENHNKFYEMTWDPDGTTWTARYGRIKGVGGVGRKENFAHFKASQWDAKYSEKIRKGYRDVSDSHYADVIDAEKARLEAEAKAKEPKEKKTWGKNVTKTALGLMKLLSGHLQSFMKTNYSIDENHITQQMIDNGDAMLKQLYDICQRAKSIDENDLPAHRHIRDEFNAVLKNLCEEIPRAMDNALSYASKSMHDFDWIYTRESDYLDTLRDLVGVNAPTFISNVSNIDDREAEYIERYGLSIKAVSSAEKDKIKALMGSEGSHYSKAWKITNKITEDSFKKYADTLKLKNKHLLFHGSATRNFHSILCQGLKINPGKDVRITGRMFGNGLYFSDSARKSKGYTDFYGSRWRNGQDDKAYLALYEVALGKTLDVNTYNREYGNYNQNNMKKKHTDSVFAHGGSGMLYNNEMIVYREDAATIRYLIEIK